MVRFGRRLQFGLKLHSTASTRSYLLALFATIQSTATSASLNSAIHNFFSIVPIQSSKFTTAWIEIIYKTLASKAVSIKDAEVYIPFTIGI